MTDTMLIYKFKVKTGRFNIGNPIGRRLQWFDHLDE